MRMSLKSINVYKKYFKNYTMWAVKEYILIIKRNILDWNTPLKCRNLLINTRELGAIHKLN